MAAAPAICDADRQQRVQAGILRSQHALPVFAANGLAVLVELGNRHPGGDLRRFKASMQDIGVMLDLTCAGRENEVVLALRTTKFPLA